MRTLVILGLIAGAVAILAPDQAPGSCAPSSMDSAGGLGARLLLAGLVIIVGETCRSAALDR
jgi:hypothetical protein